MVIAHRGASSYAPENTLAAFDLALAMGVRQIELDVDFTSDGHMVVIHDDNVDRTANGSGPVTSRTLVALRALDAGSWFGDKFTDERIPTFHEVLERYACSRRLTASAPASLRLSAARLSRSDITHAETLTLLDFMLVS
jgi:glycerophosphoryl diester phosphodiesterase